MPASNYDPLLGPCEVRMQWNNLPLKKVLYFPGLIQNEVKNNKTKHSQICTQCHPALIAFVFIFSRGGKIIQPHSDYKLQVQCSDVINHEVLPE